VYQVGKEIKRTVFQVLQIAASAGIHRNK